MTGKLAEHSETAMISRHDYITLSGMPEGHDVCVLADKARSLMAENKALMHVALDDSRVVTLKTLFDFFAPDVEIITFPAWDCLPYDRVSPHSEITAHRVAALSGLIEWGRNPRRVPRILITTVNAATQRVSPREALSGNIFQARRGAWLETDVLSAYLQKSGYIRTETVREPGEYAIRGGIIDLYPSGYEEPLRLDLFGDEIESIRSFDPISQRTNKKLSRFSIHPATEFFLDEESIRRFRARYRELFGAVRDDDPLYEAVSEGRRYNGMDHWLPLFFDKLETLFDYVPGAHITLDHLAEQARQERFEQILDFYEARKTMEEVGRQKRPKAGAPAATIYHPLPVESLYLQDKEWLEQTEDALHLLPFGATGEGSSEEDRGVDGGGRLGRSFADIRALPDGDVFKALSDYFAEQRRKSRKILVCAYSKGSRERLRSLMDHSGFANLKDIERGEDIKSLVKHEIGMALLGLSHGFTSDDLCVVTEQDILGDRLVRRTQKQRKADNFLTEVSSLSPGDLVVHIDHGIGRFEGLETLEAAGTAHDCLKIIYSGDDRLFVPVENIDVLSRFGNDEGMVQLDKLGGAGWQLRKSKIKKDLMKMADGLLKIAAARKLQKSEAYEVGSDLYDEFASGFPYQETEDQERAIHAVLSDIAKDYPADRLVCGDVGFGKTEVALRAAYVAAINGAQVAVVVPTTLLSRQHFQNFKARFKGMGLKVGHLSRLVSTHESKKTRDGIADGTVNIVIGTHALLSEKIRFSHLGLVIVDEEQRFGVKQKEKLKNLKANVHVLTLTATPIPRTLQMALTGVRELSLITTPPVDRLSIRTFVLPFDPVVLREAILREHYRGGQSFYVCPRIKDLENVEEHLRELVPEVKVVAAHGQMKPQELEDRMTDFYDGKYDVLLATNIIENGLDIPTANTMIVHRADMFGLAQLYQIRGRIGRSKVRAYAYLTYDPKKVLTQNAQKRLEVIETLDTLGSGFQLASHDMDIRGTGNLLGEEQSGHIKEVGVELYQQMLEEAVAAAREGLDWEKGEEAQEHWSPQINIGISVLIPSRYVEDLNLRMSLYRRLTELKDKSDIEAFAAEMIDRFGEIPEEVENLLEVVEIKQLCLKARVGHIEAGPKGAVIGFYKDSPADVDALMRWIQEKGGAIKLRHDQKIVAIRQWQNAAQRVRGVRGLLEEIALLS